MPFKKKTVEKFRKTLIVARDKAILETLNRIGVEAVNWAKRNGNYTDRTANLRNSINYAIFKNGHLLDDKGNLTSAQLTNIEGEIQRIKRITHLVIYAGMFYGIFVEARGYTVLSGALESSETTQLLNEALNKL